MFETVELSKNDNLHASLSHLKTSAASLKGIDELKSGQFSGRRQLHSTSNFFDSNRHTMTASCTH